MSEGRLGNVVITDENNKVVGLLSDGDLRRALMGKDFSLNLKAIDVCTKNPKMIQDKYLLASDALALIEDHKIQLLIVTNNKDELVGLLHIHDLIEAGIK
jgi:arabinose-5-phosphate isomerase